MRDQVHTVKTASGWGNKKTGAARITKAFNTKAAAVSAGRETAIKQGLEHVVHNLDGKIGYRNSYGNDPHPPKG